MFEFVYSEYDILKLKEMFKDPVLPLIVELTDDERILHNVTLKNIILERLSELKDQNNNLNS